jgi:site-specific recombinase XerD
MIRIFFERLIEWDWPDAPRRNPILHGDIPPRPEPLPRFLDDRDATKLMAAARAHPDPRTRLVVEILARTGLRAGELCDLAADAVTQIGEAHWLRVPVGKLRRDRFIPLHPDLVALFALWCADNLDRIRAHRRLIADHRGPIDRHQVGRIVRRVARRVGVTAHPHQLRHTLATQAINRGMPLEAIAALLGHRSMDMTLTYARIADRVVADHYAAVSAKVDALYGQELPADLETTSMAKLRRQAHARMLGNELAGDVRRFDNQLVAIHQRVVEAVLASSTTVTDIHGIGSLGAAIILGHTGDVTGSRPAATSPATPAPPRSPPRAGQPNGTGSTRLATGN